MGAVGLSAELAEIHRNFWDDAITVLRDEGITTGERYLKRVNGQEVTIDSLFKKDHIPLGHWGRSQFRRFENDEQTRNVKNTLSELDLKPS
jgi:hypothetical protein